MIIGRLITKEYKKEEHQMNFTGIKLLVIGDIMLESKYTIPALEEYQKKVLSKNKIKKNKKITT